MPPRHSSRGHVWPHAPSRGHDGSGGTRFAPWVASSTAPAVSCGRSRSVPATAAGAVAVAARTTPWPSALVIRAVFDRGAARASAALAGTSRATSSRSSTRHTTSPRPTGGSTSSGHAATSRCRRSSGCTVAPSCRDPSRDVANYLRVLAGRGLTTVGVDYSIAPGSRYPTPVKQVAAALAHLVDHADRLGVDPARVVLAGDSAGAQIAAQVALLVTDPAYAAEVGIEVDVPPSSLQGLVLFCGAYDFSARAGIDPPRQLARRHRDLVLPRVEPAPRRADHPAGHGARCTSRRRSRRAFVSAGNGDPLLPHTLGARRGARAARRRPRRPALRRRPRAAASGTSTSSTSTAPTGARRWTALSPSCTASPAEAAAERGLSTVGGGQRGLSTVGTWGAGGSLDGEGLLSSR